MKQVPTGRMRTRERMAVARAKGKLRGMQPKLSTRQQRGGTSRLGTASDRYSQRYR